MLKSTPTHVIDCHDLDRFFKDTYDIEIDSLRMELECNNGSYLTYTVDGERELDSIEDDFLYETWVSTGQMKDIELPEEFAIQPYFTHSDIRISHVLHRLFLDGHIVAGEYLVKFWW